MDAIDSSATRMQPAVWWTILVVAAVVAVGGGLLFFWPEAIVPRWPWDVGPFTAAFLGAIYLAEFCVAVLALWYGRWAPARLLLYQGLPFVAVVTLASFIYPDMFVWSRKTTWIWFILYGSSVLLGTWFAWVLRHLGPESQVAVRPWLRTILLIEAVVCGLYFLALWIAPLGATAFWPWPIDAFHARLYSAVFLALAVGAGVLWRGAAPAEYQALGLAQAVFGALSVVGLVVVDGRLQAVSWNAPGTWVWIAVAAALVAIGVLLMRIRSPEPALAGTS